MHLPAPVILATGLFGAHAPAIAHPQAHAFVAAERAFAADVAANGVKQGFLRSAAPDGIMFDPGPVNARDLLTRMPDGPTPGPALMWWPLFAGSSNAGDLGFTTGAANIPVRYFTVWQRQTDGSLRWIYDGGPPLAAPMASTPADPVTYLQPSSASAGSAAKALEEIAPIEAMLARRAEADAPEAYRAVLAEDGLIAGSPLPGGIGRAEHAQVLARRPASLSLRPINGVASQAGDLAFTYGEARWSRDGAARWGHYVRIWQKRSEGWRLAIDMLIPARGPQPAA